jgi:outer membrane receptor for ferrienterochelin and colicin
VHLPKSPRNNSTFPKNYYNDSQLRYIFQNGTPTQVTAWADQASQQEQVQNMFALYAQDRWTIRRLSLLGGLRFERLYGFGVDSRFPRLQIVMHL